MQNENFQIYTLKVNTIIWHCKKIRLLLNEGVRGVLFRFFFSTITVSVPLYRCAYVFIFSYTILQCSMQFATNYSIRFCISHTSHDFWRIWWPWRWIYNTKKDLYKGIFNCFEIIEVWSLLINMAWYLLSTIMLIEYIMYGKCNYTMKWRFFALYESSNHFVKINVFVAYDP